MTAKKENNEQNLNHNELNEDSSIENNANNAETEASVINALSAELNDYKDKYLRLLAEVENSRKQMQKQLEDTREYSISKFAKELLVVLDIFNKAFSNADLESIKDEQAKNFIVGIDLTKQELEKILSKFGVKALADNLVGEEFNPNFHEALMTKPDEAQKNGTIFEVFEQGYSLNDRLLRAAKVGIIKN